MNRFPCGHPRAPENSQERLTGYSSCKLCVRIKSICRQHRRDQERINRGTFYSTGERIARGLVG